MDKRFTLLVSALMMTIVIISDDFDEIDDYLIRDYRFNAFDFDIEQLRYYALDYDGKLSAPGA